MDPDLAPIFALFGSTIYDCQVLEADLRFMLFLSEKFENARPFPKEEDPVSSKYTNRTLYKLIEFAKHKNVLSGIDIEVIDSARSDRNELVHDFLYSRARLMTTPAGRGQVLSELKMRKARMQLADKHLEKVIDVYLKHVGTSTEQLKVESEAYWQSDADASSIH